MLASLFFVDSGGQLITSRRYRKLKDEIQTKGSLPIGLRQAIMSRSGYQQLKPIYYEDDSSNAYIAIARDGVHLIALTDLSESTDTLFVISMLETMYSILRKYFGLPLTDALIRSRFDVLYKLLDEMVEGGYPFCLELNNLESTAAPPSSQGLMDKLVSALSSGASASVSNSLTGVSPETWWRRAGVCHSSNECYMEVVDKINCIMSPAGRMISGSISGSISVISRLSGIPELLVSLKDSSLFETENISFHPCVRLPRWDKERKLSFIPPDGQFILADYTIFDQSKAVLPFTVQTRLDFDSYRGTLSMTLSPRLSILDPQESSFGQKPSQPRVIENMCIKLRVAPVIASTTLFTQNGSTVFDASTGLVLWNIGTVKSDSTKISLEGTLQYNRGGSDASLAREFKPCVSAQFTVKGWAASGIKIDALEVSCVDYTPYKGCRYATKAGSVDIRI